MNSKNNKKTVLLIGATGLIGSALGELLVKQDYHVCAFLRDRHDEFRLTFKPATICFGDLNDATLLSECLSGIHFVLYFASTSIPSDSPFNPVNEISSTLPLLHNLLQAMTISGGHLIFPSTGGAIYGNTLERANEVHPLAPTSSYGLGKLLSEEIIRFYSTVSDIKYSILRFSNIYGSILPRARNQGIIDRFLDDVIRKKVSPVWGDVTIARDFLQVEDAASAILEVLNHSLVAVNEIFNIGSGLSHTIQDVLNIINEVTHGQHRYEIVQGQFSGPKSSVIDTQKFRESFPNWRVNLDLCKGINRAWQNKLAIMAKAV